MAEAVKEEPADFDENAGLVQPEYYSITDVTEEDEDSKCDINLDEISSTDTDEKVDVKHDSEYYQQFLDKEPWDAGEGTSKQPDSNKTSGLVESIKEEFDSDNSDMEAENDDETEDSKSLFEEQLHELQDSNTNAASDEDGQKRPINERGGMEQKKNSFSCQYCDHVTKTEKLLSIHIASTHHATLSYKCKYCSYQTRRPIDFGCHVSNHFRAGKIKCDICNFIADSKRKLVSHKAKIHKIRTQKTSKSATQSQYQCDICVFTAKSKTGLANHKATQHHISKTKHKCNKCNYTANSLTAFLNHKAKHYLQTTESQPVTQTKIAFKSKNQPMRMIRSVNNIPEVYECIYCPYKTRVPTELGIHVAEHQQEEVECDVCLLKLESRTSLSDHKAKYHDIQL